MIHTDFTSENIASVARAACPSLTSLALRFGRSVSPGAGDVLDEEDLGCAACAPEDVARLLQTSGLPALRHLGLVGLAFADEVAARLGARRWSGGSTSLDLSKGRMTDAGVEHLLSARRALAHLETLDVSDNFLLGDAVAALEEAFPDSVVAYERGEDPGSDDGDGVDDSNDEDE